jgi:hypothetical protein
VTTLSVELAAGKSSEKSGVYNNKLATQARFAQEQDTEAEKVLFQDVSPRNLPVTYQLI